VPRYEIGGRVALITGGARGIGLGIAAALASRGAKIVLVDIDADTVAQSAARLGSGRAIGVQADVTDAAGLQAATGAAIERFGGIDVVVANAGIAPNASPVHLMAPEEWERVVEVNLLGVYRTVRAGIEQVIARGGQVVLVSSVYAFVNGMLMSPYAVAKAGVEQLGRALHAELSIHGASATVAYFGFVDTRMVQDAMDARRAATGREDEALPAFMTKRISPQQAGEAVARAIERRAPRVIAPRFWTPTSVLRGVIGPPLDRIAPRTARVRQALQDAESAFRDVDSASDAAD
jgi:NAD(P)-dependent dehydrogenase (short-subunit alcohol dehydrogenase family)